MIILVPIQAYLQNFHKLPTCFYFLYIIFKFLGIEFIHSESNQPEVSTVLRMLPQLSGLTSIKFPALMNTFFCYGNCNDSSLKDLRKTNSIFKGRLKATLKHMFFRSRGLEPQAYHDRKKLQA